MRQIFSSIASLFGKGGPSDHRLATHVFWSKTTANTYSSYTGYRAGTVACRLSTWWEARRLKGTDLYKIQRHADLKHIERLPESRVVERRATVPQDIIYNGKKAVSLAEAIDALREFETQAMTSPSFDSISDKQPFIRYHWSRMAEILPQQIKQSGLIRLKGPAPSQKKP